MSTNWTLASTINNIHTGPISTLAHHTDQQGNRRYQTSPALPSPPSRPIGRIACAQNFPHSYFRLPGILNDPFFSECGSDGCSEDCQCFRMVRTTPKIAHSPWNFVTLPEEDRATAISNMHRKIDKGRGCGSGDMRADRQRDRQTLRKTHTQTCSSQYFANAAVGEVTRLVDTCSLCKTFAHFNHAIPFIPLHLFTPHKIEICREEPFQTVN